MSLYEKKVHELQEMLSAKEITSVELTLAYLDRIDAVDDKIKAYITVDHAGALAKAEESGQEKSSG